MGRTLARIFCCLGLMLGAISAQASMDSVLDFPSITTLQHPADEVLKKPDAPTLTMHVLLPDTQPIRTTNQELTDRSGGQTLISIRQSLSLVTFLACIGPGFADATGDIIACAFFATCVLGFLMLRGDRLRHSSIGEELRTPV